MRTTVNLDEDVDELASVYAMARDMTLGAAISELVRRSQMPAEPSRIAIADNGLPLIRSNGRKLTPELIKATQDDEFVRSKTGLLLKKRFSRGRRPSIGPL
jgi:predicted transcriptional regulator